jgi:hypothetical protein
VNFPKAATVRIIGVGGMAPRIGFGDSDAARPMKNTDWPKVEIERIAKASGKPLEVACAQAFLAEGWKARLGSYFEDGLAVRELDVLAVREELLPAPHHFTVRVRALVSCRGFPPERSPLVYSVSTSCVPSFAPRLMSSFRVYKCSPGAQTYGRLLQAEADGAAQLFRHTQLNTARPVVSFDIIEQTKKVSKHGKDEGKVTFDYRRPGDGDRQLFGAVDSCVKAGMFWLQQDYQQEPTYFATLNVPVCVLSVPFWDACIDGGVVAPPEIQHRGYQTILHPYHEASREFMSLLWSVEEFPALVTALNYLFGWFRGEMKQSGFEGTPPAPA